MPTPPGKNTSWNICLAQIRRGRSWLPNGVEEIFFQSPPERGPWLVCTATITERKRVLELAEAAVAAQTPVWIIGRPYTDEDVYAKKFLALARTHPQWIRFEGPVNDRASLAKIYREARGFVLLSTKETRSLSSEEAAASGCPLLLSDLPWAKSTFGEARGVRYCPITERPTTTAGVLKEFYDLAPQLPTPPRPATWGEVGYKIKAVYELVLK